MKKYSLKISIGSSYHSHTIVADKMHQGTSYLCFFVGDEIVFSSPPSRTVVYSIEDVPSTEPEIRRL